MLYYNAFGGWFYDQIFQSQILLWDLMSTMFNFATGVNGKKQVRTDLLMNMSYTFY